MIVQIEQDGEEDPYSEPLISEKDTHRFVEEIFRGDPAEKFCVDQFMDKWRKWEKRRSKAEALYQSTKKEDVSTPCESRNNVSNDTDQQQPKPSFKHRFFFCSGTVDKRDEWALRPGDLGFFLDGIVAIKDEGEDIARTDEERGELLDRKFNGEEVVVFLLSKTWKQRCDDVRASRQTAGEGDAYPSPQTDEGSDQEDEDEDGDDTTQTSGDASENDGNASSEDDVPATEQFKRKRKVDGDEVRAAKKR